MAIDNPRITSEDRDRFWDALSPNLLDSDNNLIPHDLWADRGLYALEKVDPELYNKLVKKFLWAGFQKFTTEVAKKNQTAVVRNSKNGKSRTVSRYVSVKEVTEDGSVVERQKLVETLNIKELGQVKEDLKKQVESLGFNIEMTERLIALCVHYSVKTVQEALDASGQTVEDVLG